MTTQLVTLMKMGQDIPEWLLVAEPEQPGAIPGSFRFGVDLEIIDTPNYFLVRPIHDGPFLTNHGMVGHRIYAPSKPVILAAQQQIWLGIEYSAQCDAFQAAVRQAQLQAVQPIPDPHRGFWRRLWWALSGD